MKSKRPYLPYLILFFLISLACQPVNEQLLVATQSPGEPGVPTPSPTPCPGCSRDMPIPAGQTLHMQNWDVQVLETIRGEEAWEILYEANYFNDPPPAGGEYLMVKFHIQNTDRSGEDRDLALHVTGSSFRLHYSFDTSVVTPDPPIELDLEGGAASEGWEAYLIRENEHDLLLVAEEWFNDEEPVYYLALEEGASLSISEAALESVAKTDVGRTLTEPAQMGQITTGNHWQLAVDQVIVGDEAYKMAVAENQFNDPPPKGMEYVAFYARTRYIGTDDAGESIDEYDFELMNIEGDVFERPSLVNPEPELDYHLYPGGDGEGWVVLQAPKDEQNIILRFIPDYNENSPNTRYLTLVQYGR